MRKFMIALTLVLFIQGCGGESVESLVLAAKSKLERKDNAAAIVDLKIVLQRQPQNAEARFLLGRALSAVGDERSAMLELEKASQQGFIVDQVLPELAATLLAQHEYKKITDQYTDVKLADQQAQAKLKTAVAIANFRQNLSAHGEVALAEALRADPNFALARVWQAILIARTGESAAALKLLDGVIESNPASREAWQAKGEILQTTAVDGAASIAAFKRAIEADRKYLPAYFSLINTALLDRDIPAMSSYLELLKTVSPSGAQTRYFEAQLALIKNDLGKAREISQQLLRVAPDSARLLYLAGIVEFMSNATALANSYLSKAITLDPSFKTARQLLIKSYLKSGEPEKAIAALAPLMADPKVDAETLAQAAEANLQLGNVDRAELLYAKAAQSKPDSAKIRTALALLSLNKGQLDAGFKELTAVAASDPGIYADLALISARMRRGNYESALDAINNLSRKQPKMALAADLKGRVLLAKKDQPGARASFEAALALEPKYYPAVGALAALDVEERAPDRARARVQAVLKSDPTNSRALLAMAELLVANGSKADEIEALVRKAISANPGEARPRLAMIRFYIAKHKVKAAVDEARAAVLLLPEDNALLEALGQAQSAAGEVQQAVNTYKKLAVRSPKSPLPHLRLADLYLTTKDYTATASSLNKALEVAPSFLQAYRGLIHLALKDRRYDDAVKVAKRAQVERPKDEAGFVMQGDIEARRSNWDAALAAYRVGLQRARTSEIGAKMHKTLLSAGRPAEAERFASSWLKEQSGDVAFLFYLGDYQTAKGDFAAAEANYRAVLKLRPEHALALNNAAFAILKQGKAGALELAFEANKIAPDTPDLMDTLALALLAENQPAKALELQRRTVQSSPGNYVFRLTLAKAMLQAGDKAGAKVELDGLAALGRQFSGADEVAKLRQSM